MYSRQPWRTDQQWWEIAGNATSFVTHLWLTVPYHWPHAIVFCYPVFFAVIYLGLQASCYSCSPRALLLPCTAYSHKCLLLPYAIGCYVYHCLLLLTITFCYLFIKYGSYCVLLEVLHTIQWYISVMLDSYPYQCCYTMGVQYYFVQPLLELSSWNDNSSTCDQEELATQVESSLEDELAEYWDNVGLDQITRDFDFNECEKLDNDNYQSDIPNRILRFMLVFLPLWASVYNKLWLVPALWPQQLQCWCILFSNLELTPSNTIQAWKRAYCWYHTRTIRA